jgi:gliding motility-associated-like protein
LSEIQCNKNLSLIDKPLPVLYLSSIKKIRRQYLLPLYFGLAAFFFHCVPAAAQECPPNIDFERGNFDGWTCYTGFTAAVNSQNQINLTPSGGPSPQSHVMYTANSGEVDFFGGFSVNCPNGSGHSIRLGNSTGGGEAEGISYDFTIPLNRNVYSLIYHYAVVFEDPKHEQYQQPRMVVEITNVSDGTTIDCSSFTFVPYGSILPGFFESPNPGDDGTPVWCKDWSAVSINLDNLAGKTIRLFFKTADCTFRRHFGYAYIDVNSECSSEFTGATYCNDDTAVTVVAPYGYQNYTWYNSTFTQVLGSQQKIRFSPPPPAGTTIAVEVVPYNGYGCLDTLYAKLIDTLTLTAFAGPDILFCGDNPVTLGAIPKPGLVYQWTPSVGLNDPTVANPLASPGISTQYILSVRNGGGGCLNSDTVIVTSSSIDNSLELIGKATFCFGTGDSAVLKVKPADSIQWYKNGLVITGAHQPLYRVTQSGTYHAKLFSDLGCIIITRSQAIFIDKARPGIRYPVEYAVIDMPYQLEARTFGASVLWTPPEYLDNETKVNPFFRGSFDQQFTITIKTSTGCTTVDTQLVKTVKGVEIYVPTAFTPNDDGLNDVLRPLLMGVKELHYFRVYNRWGELLFETRKIREGWDGKFKGMKQPPAVVVWLAEAVGSDGRTYLRRGTSMLVR